VPVIDTIELGSNTGYAILAASSITNTLNSKITGDIGLSPATGSNVAKFAATEVTGKIITVDATYSGNPITPTIDATTLTINKGDLTIAYNAAAGRTPIPSGPFLNPGGGNLAGLTLDGGLYKFSAACLLDGAALTLDGKGNDKTVWIFQVGTALTAAAYSAVTLTNGAKASNVFWQVGTSAAFGVNSVFSGTVMADQSITFGTGAVLNGRALARIAAVTLQSTTILDPELP
jgi:hypothetical protein